MGWNESRFDRAKKECEELLDSDKKKPYDLMEEYKDAIRAEDYEKAKAISETLKPLNYFVADTHMHINEIN